MRLHFLTYATPHFLSQAHHQLDSALRSGFDTGRVFGPEDLRNTDFYTRHAKTLNAPRGGGYWLWKPYLLLEAVRQLGENECVVYNDAGRSRYYAFTSRPECLLTLMRREGQGFLLGCPMPHLGLVGQWTRRDCLELMSAMEPDILNAPLLATWGLWTRTPLALSFLEAWLEYACDPRCLTDQPNLCGQDNLPGFRDHRHDQSILSILAWQRCAPIVDTRHSVVQGLMRLRPGSELAHNFYKRPQNAEDMLSGVPGPQLLLREYLRLKSFRADVHA